MTEAGTSSEAAVTNDSDSQGTLREDISRDIVGLYKRYSGKGPVRCHTYLQSELVTVVLGGGYTASEQTMFEDGKWHEVREARQSWQDSMQRRFVEVIEERTGRAVVAFMSANHQDPDLAVELFVLENGQLGAKVQGDDFVGSGS